MHNQYTSSETDIDNSCSMYQVQGSTNYTVMVLSFRMPYPLPLSWALCAAHAGRLSPRTGTGSPGSNPAPGYPSHS